VSDLSFIMAGLEKEREKERETQERRANELAKRLEAIASQANESTAQMRAERDARPPTFNITAYANQLYDYGHTAEHFREGGPLKPGIVVLSGVLPPALDSTGLHRTDKSRAVPVQFALSHRVEAVGSQTIGALAVGVGDIVKVREGHLDILDPRNTLAAIRDEHIVKVIARARDVIDPSKTGDTVPA
jgi:hypothetical protein